MGIYPHTEQVRSSVVRDGEQLETIVDYHHVPGVTRIRVFEKVAEFEIRDDCYCCSCRSGEGGDPYCRNHGFAGQRPCDVHQMPGQTDENGVMPASVQTERARLAGLR